MAGDDDARDRLEAGEGQLRRTVGGFPHRECRTQARRARRQRLEAAFRRNHTMAAMGPLVRGRRGRITASPVRSRPRSTRCRRASAAARASFLFEVLRERGRAAGRVMAKLLSTLAIADPPVRGRVTERRRSRRPSRAGTRWRRRDQRHDRRFGSRCRPDAIRLDPGASLGAFQKNLIDNTLQHRQQAARCRALKGSLCVEAEDEALGHVLGSHRGPGFEPGDLPGLRAVLHSPARRHRPRLGAGATIVEEHGGEVDASNRPEGGAGSSCGSRGR